MKTSRQKILDYLRLHHACTAGELSRVMQMTPANARHHLKILAEQGAVVIAGERLSSRQRGRPEKIYRLAEAARGHNLDRLADQLLRVIRQSSPPAWQDDILMAVASGLVESTGGGELQRSLGPRLVQAVQRLSHLNYQARWEARPQAPEIFFGFCPYQEIISDHPELCRMDAELLWLLTGRQVQQQTKLAPDGLGGRFCRFVLLAR